MRSINLADAKTHLSKLVERAAAGEPVLILRRGKPIAQITSVEEPRTPIDLSALRALTQAMPKQKHGAADMVRKMRDDAR